LEEIQLKLVLLMNY